MPILSNVKVNWAKVHEPSKSVEYGDKWEVEAELSTEQKNNFIGMGLKVKQNDKGVDTIRIKRKTTGVKRAGGTFDKQPPKVVDSVIQPFSDAVGNGSVCNIAYNVFEGNAMFPTSLDLAGLQVLDLVPYGGGGKDAADEFESVDNSASFNASVDDDSAPF